MKTSVTKYLFSILLSSVFVFCGSLVTAQDTKSRDKYRWGISAKPLNSETNNVFMSALRDLIKMETDSEKVLILVARLGKGEKNQRLNRRRLHNVKAAINMDEDSLIDKRIISTEGERINDYGRVEVYWNGELVGGLPVNRNSDLLTDCCGPNPRYYPYKVDRPKTSRK